MGNFYLDPAFWSLQELHDLHDQIKAELISGGGKEVTSYSVGGKSVVKGRGVNLADMMSAVKAAIRAKSGQHVTRTVGSHRTWRPL